MAYTLVSSHRLPSHPQGRPRSGGARNGAKRIAGLAHERGFRRRQLRAERQVVGTNLLYEDPELGFQILAHIMDRDYAGGPHDHGDSWAIYGQAVKHTEMNEWKRTDDGSVPAKRL